MINPFKSKYESNLDSTYVPQYALGVPTSPQTANQIAEATSRLNAGVFGVDLALIDERLFEQIPKQHFKEIDRLMQLTGAKATIHGPIVDLAGFTQQGWQEEGRRETERKINYYMDMAHEVDPKGNTPINFHINTAMIGKQKRKLSKEEYQQLSEEEKKTVTPIINPLNNQREYEVVEIMGAVDQETGQVNPLKREVKYYPGRVKVWTPEERLGNLNQTRWDQEKLKIFQLQQQKAEIEDRRGMIARQLQPLDYGHERGVLSREEEAERGRLKKSEQLWDEHIQELDQHIYTGLNEIHNDLRYIKKEVKDALKEKRFDVDKEIKNMSERHRNTDEYIKGFADNEQRRIFETLRGKNISKEEAQEIYQEKMRELNKKVDMMHDQQYRELQRNLNALPAPEKFISTNNLAKEKTAETVSNVVFEAYKKYKDNAPLMLLENLMPEGTLGSAQDLVDTIEASRTKLVNKLIKEKNMGKDKAEDVANKLIGVTWDVGHINFMRKHGYTEADVIRETKKIAPYVKQVHITDNFGFNDAHLPPGMGNAPIKEEMVEIVREMRKKGLEFKKGSVIVEAGSYVGQFKESPHPPTLEYFESPLYTYKAKPYWKDIWETEAPYGLGYGTILPEQHFQMYGAGFSNLPVDLGGPISQDRSRFAGTPNA